LRYLKHVREKTKKKWPIISSMLRFIFRNTCITISIYDLNRSILNNDETTNKINIIGTGFFFSDHTLRKNILLDASHLSKIEEVPSDGDCGAHALRVCLRGDRGIHNRNIKEN